MGLDTSHDCWHGAYSSFMRWRTKLCEVAGYGDITTRLGYSIADPEAGEPFPDDDPLSVLLSHSDCDGEIEVEHLLPLAARLEELLPAMDRAGDGGGHIGGYGEKTRQFIDGLRAAARAGEPVEFW